jgi:CDP-diglyceride synthetase
MEVYLLLSAVYIWGLGIALAIHIILFWKKAEKKQHRISEILQVILFLVHGFQVVFLFNFDSPLEQELAIILFVTLSIAFIVLFGLNILPNIIALASNADYRKDLTYARFIATMEQTDRPDRRPPNFNNVKDISRKALHVLQFAGIATFYYLSITYFPSQDNPGFSSLEFRNYAFVMVASLFWITMIIGDLTRMGNWKYLPKWAMNWFRISLDLDKEKWTINGATSILLANLLWIQAFIPIQVLFVAAWVSCISDAAASFIGKRFGKHKILSFGKFPNKSWEGLVVGLFTTILGVIAIFYAIPVNFSFLAVFGCAVAVGVGFGAIDLYATHICDNLLNSIVSGSLTWLFLLIV